MDKQACGWPDGCNRGGFREVDTAPLGHPGRRWLCLQHAGRVWNARRQANREAGLCPCGSAVTPGNRTCARCREQGRIDRQRARAMTRAAAECGIVLPRQAGRRNAFFGAFRLAASRSRRRAKRAWWLAVSARLRLKPWQLSRIGLSIIPAPATSSVSVSWEGRPVTVQATFGEAGAHVHGVPARGAGA